MASADSRGELALLSLPAELRLLIYAHLTAPALLHKDANWDERSARWYKDIYTKVLPETKLIYFTLHALSASCSTLHAEMKAPIEEVRAMLAKQKYYLQSHMVVFEFQGMKGGGMTWADLERELGIAAGPDFTDGVTDLDESGCEDPDLYPHLHPGIYFLARRKEWQKMMQRDHGKGYRRWRNLERSVENLSL